MISFLKISASKCLLLNSVLPTDKFEGEEGILGEVGIDGSLKALGAVGALTPEGAFAVVGAPTEDGALAPRGAPTSLTEPTYEGELALEGA